MKARTYSLNEVFDSTYLGFIFEFYCSKEPSFIVEDFKKILGKNIILTNNETIKPTFSSSILLKEYDGKRPRFQFKVGLQKYNEISAFLNTILFWINENAYLNNSTLLKVNLDFNFNQLKTLSTISNMDIGKLILKINEDYIYERFIEMTDNPHALSIKKLIPYNMTINASNIVDIRNQFKFPIANFYGVNLVKQTLGDISFNYIGGPKYSEKIKEIYEILKYYIVTTYQVINTNEFLSSDVHELNKLTEEYRTFRKCYYNPKRFLDLYKDISVFIDLNNSPNLIETQWFQIRDVLSKIILECNIKKCKFNWDTSEGTFQIKNAEIKNCLIKDLHIIDSKISGVIESCQIWKSEINNSRIIKSTLIIENKVSNCYIENTRADRYNKINESFIFNNGEIINCDVNNSIIKNAGIGNLAKLDENCLVIYPIEKILNPAENGLKIKEIRDYKWIKSLRDPFYKDLGFANEYRED